MFNECKIKKHFQGTTNIEIRFILAQIIITEAPCNKSLPSIHYTTTILHIPCI